MTAPDETRRAEATRATLDCPSCGMAVHRSAVECGRCGYRSAVAIGRDFLQSLSLVSSILFGLIVASLVELRGPLAEENATSLFVAAAVWFAGAVCLTIVLVFGELGRQRRFSDAPLELSLAEEEQLEDRCSDLFGLFCTSLALFAVGMIALAFSISDNCGWGAAALSIVICLTARVLFRSRSA